MKKEGFFEKFDLFADAPGAVSKLRELILELAVRGKLSEQSSSDYNDKLWHYFIERFNLLERTHESDSPLPFKIPGSWRWVTLNDLGETKPRNQAPDATKVSFVPMAMISAKYGRHIEHEEREWGDIKQGYTHFADGDVVMAKITPCFENAKSAFMSELHGGIGAGTTELHVFRRHSKVVQAKFVLIYLKSRGYIQRGIPYMTGSAGQKRVPHDYFANSPFPLPPPAEQRRIVAKVDQLMALCDRLEAQEQERETKNNVLAHASLARVTKNPTRDNLNFIFNDSYLVEPADMRKTIISLAVQGKLVPQDQNDEPGHELIARLSKKMSIESRRRQGTILPEPIIDSVPYKIPDSWKWARFSDIAIIASNLVNPRDYLDLKHIAPDNIEKGSGVLLPCCTVREDKVTSSNHRFYPGQIVYSKIRPNLAKVVIVDFDGLCSADMYPINALIDAKFLQYYMLSEAFLVQAVKTDTRVAMPKINQAELNSIAVPVAPLVEQSRIVVKVNQLMILVDQIEAQLRRERSASASLMEAIVEELTTQA
jgi:type I restriction enzyme S subunit